MLNRWIIDEHCRLVAVLGMGGIGKSTLATKVVQPLAEPSSDSPFEVIIWRSLRHAPPLKLLLTDWILCLSDQQESHIDRSRLLHYLRSRRCLLVLDNVETLFQEGDCAGYYRLGYEDYGELFQHIGEVAHQSCLLLTSREKPSNIAALEDGAFVRSLHLSGSPEASQALIESKTVFGSAAQKQTLASWYSHNPLAIKIVTSFIQDVFDGDIEQFLQQETILFNGLRRLLEQQFERLSHLERTVMYWLAVNRDWTSIDELTDDIVPEVSRASLLEVLESLAWRSLIEKRLGHYTQQPVVMEYVTSDFTEQIATELVTQRPLLLDRHALLKTTANDYIRQTQACLILDAIASKLWAAFKDASSLHQHLQHLIQRLRTQSTPSIYSAGNLINLLRHLKCDLNGLDLSGLHIVHASLQGIPLRQVNFQGATFEKVALTQTFGTIFTVAFSPNSQILAAGDEQGQVNLWRVADGQAVMTLQAHDSWIKSIAWSPDGQTLATSSADRVIKLWNVSDGTCRNTLLGHETWIRSVTWSPDGTKLASGSADQTVRIWDIQTGEAVTLDHRASVWAVVWSPDGQTLASGGDDCIVRLWDWRTETCLRELQGHTYGIKSLAWNPNGRSLASGSDDQTTKIWDVKSGQCFKTLQGHTGSIWSLAWHPEGEKLATSSHDQTVRIWNSPTAQCLRLLQGHTNWVWSVTWSPDGAHLATGSHDQTIKVWNGQMGVCLKTLQGYNSQVRCVRFSPDGQYLASGCVDQRVRVWDLARSHVVQTFKGHSNAVWAVAWSFDGRYLASAAHDQTIGLWEMSTGHCLCQLHGHTSFVWSVAWSPDGQCLASAGADQTVRVWNTQGDCLKILEGHRGWVFAIAWSPDGHYLASSGTDNVVRLWEIETGTCINVIEGHTRWVWSLAWHPSQLLLASSSGDASVRVWDIQTGECVQTLQGHTNWVSAIAWSPDGTTTASGSVDQTVKLWDVSSGQIVNVFEGHTRQITSVDIQTTGDLLASGSEDGTIKLWSIVTGKCLQTLRSERPYEGMNIAGIQGITDTQKAKLLTLGACEPTVGSNPLEY